MANNYLRGVLGFKGERGFSAYETAVQNGFGGTEQEWLATLGTSSHFTEEKTVYVTTTANETTLTLPSSYNKVNTFVNVYVEGFRLDPDGYTINESAKTITLTNALEVVGTRVEIVLLKMSTNNLPIVDSVTSDSDNETAAGTKAVYDFVKAEATTLNQTINSVSSSLTTSLNNTKTSLNTTNSNVTALTNEVNELETNTNKALATKVNASDIKVLTGETTGINSGETKIANIPYPSGFTKANTIILSKMVSSNNSYYDTTSTEETQNGFVNISMIALTDEYVRVWFKNIDADEALIGHYKITLMKVS